MNENYNRLCPYIDYPKLTISNLNNAENNCVSIVQIQLTNHIHSWAPNGSLPLIEKTWPEWIYPSHSGFRNLSADDVKFFG